MNSEEIFRPSKLAWEDSEWKATQIYLEQMKQYQQIIEANEKIKTDKLKNEQHYK